MKIKREIKIGVLFIVSIAIFIWGVNFLKSKDIFSSQKVCYAYYPKVDGLVASNPVYISGIKVGYIKDVSFISNESSSVKVAIVISSDIKVPVNSIAKIYSADLMGSKAIQILMGDSKEKIKGGEILKSDIEADLKEEISRQVVPLKLKAEELMSSFDSVLIAVKLIFNTSTQKNLSQSFENIKITLENIKNTTYNVDTLVSTQRNRLASIINNFESISHNIRNNNEKISNIISNFSSISDTLAKANIAQTIQSANKALGEMSAIMQKINKGEGSLGMLVNDDSLYKKLESSAKNLDLLLEDFRLHPDRYVKISVFGGKKKQ
ncbi:MAG: MlaD family protein [Bacteroidetes bacterium]|nr:MlaD family protein [Bacteroidota bacterium]